MEVALFIVLEEGLVHGDVTRQPAAVFAVTNHKWTLTGAAGKTGKFRLKWFCQEAVLITAQNRVSGNHNA